MDYSFLIELFGYLGSAMVVVSMLMSSVVKLRIINTLGSVISGTYALIIGSFPLALMNICLVVINLYNLRKLLITKQQYHLVKCRAEDASVLFFLQQYQEDIRQYFPDFQQPRKDTDVSYLVFCNTAPAGIMTGRAAAPGTVQVDLEYTTPAYRDCSIGKYLYTQLPAEGITALAVASCSPAHKPYLEKMGYTAQGAGYHKTLA